MQKPIADAETEMLDWGQWRGEVFILLTSSAQLSKTFPQHWLLQNMKGRLYTLNSVVLEPFMHGAVDLFPATVSYIIIYTGSLPEFNSLCVSQAHHCVIFLSPW